jgi:acyl-CoA synthetase (AMP-forming)/AMP-acid ligase II
MLIDEKSVWSLIVARSELTPDAVLAIDEHDRSISFSEYREAVERAASGLYALGLRPGARVAWQLPTWIEAMVLVGALSRLGTVQVPMLPLYREREVRFILAQARPELMIIPSRWRDFDYEELARRVVREVQGEGSAGCRIQVCDRLLPEADPAGLPVLGAVPDADAARWVFYTSGTTADPKGALHSDRSLIAGSYGTARSYGCSPADRYALVFPFTHIGGIGMLLVQLISGCGAAITERFNPEATIPILSRQGVTLLAGGTPFALLCLDAQRRHPGERLFPALRAVITGAAPTSDDLHARIRDELGGSGALSCYGLTEVPFLSVSSVDDPDDKRGRTEGRPVAGAEIRVVAEEGASSPPGVQGEIRARGPQVCLGYLETGQNADAFDAEGFFRTGDLGSLDADGYVSVLGRLKDVIIRKGENISAKEVEDVLATHPEIADVAVIGRADAALGERCCAVVVPAPGAPAIDLPALAAFCRQTGIATQKIPEELQVVDVLPRNASGKVLKYQLKQAFP